MREGFVDLPAGRFFVREWGDAAAPPVLLLHGFPEYSGAWAEVASRLADQFRLIAPDQRGYGHSIAPQAVTDYAPAKLVADMAALIDHIGAGPIPVVGHDWGAAVAYGLAILRPDLVARLVILNGVHPGPFQRALAAGGAQSAASQYIDWLRTDGSEDVLAANDFARLRGLFGANMDMAWLSGATLDDYLREWARPARLRGMVNWYRASPMRVARPGVPITDLPAPNPDRLRIACPHLLIWGEGDRALLPEATVGLEDYAPGLIRVTVPGTDHWLHHQAPDAVAGAIRGFL
jgi:pimeloyl-ACP methyl ester carboxylesterase